MLSAQYSVLSGGSTDIDLDGVMISESKDSHYLNKERVT
jgi:hypothetical protein